MKLVCDCGNEAKFVEDNENIDENTIEEQGNYTSLDCSKFDSWAEHDESGFTCQKCGKTIWFFS